MSATFYDSEFFKDFVRKRFEENIRLLHRLINEPFDPAMKIGDTYTIKKPTRVTEDRCNQDVVTK